MIAREQYLAQLEGIADIYKLDDNHYILTKTELLSLLENEIVLECLNIDGVDNWSWYMESRENIIASYLGITPQEVINNDYTFRDAAKELLKIQYDGGKENEREEN